MKSRQVELVKTGLVGRMMNVRRMGRILEIAQSMRRTRGRISNPRLSAGVDVIKPTSAQWPTTAASPQVRVSYDLGKVVTQRITVSSAEMHSPEPLEVIEKLAHQGSKTSRFSGRMR